MRIVIKFEWKLIVMLQPGPTTLTGVCLAKLTWQTIHNSYVTCIFCIQILKEKNNIWRMEKTCDAALADIEEYFRQYNKLGELGRGKFGTVFHVQQIENGKFFASKHIR